MNFYIISINHKILIKIGSNIIIIIKKEVKNMRRQTVHSSNLVSIGYDANSEILEVEYRTSIYQYYDVPESDYIGLMSDASKGRYLSKHIKNKFKEKRIK